MSKKGRKRGEIPGSDGLKIELEENAEDLFLEYLEKVPSDISLDKEKSNIHGRERNFSQNRSHSFSRLRKAKKDWKDCKDHKKKAGKVSTIKDDQTLFLESLEKIPHNIAKQKEQGEVSFQTPRINDKRSRPPLDRETDPVRKEDTLDHEHGELDHDERALFLEYLEKIPKNASKMKADGEERPKRKKKPKKRKSEPIEVDLHGLTLEEAIRYIDQFISQYLPKKSGSDLKIKVITGKGLRSGPSGGVLPREIHRHIKDRYFMSIKEIEASPDEVKVDNIPIRGHFFVVF